MNTLMGSFGLFTHILSVREGLDLALQATMNIARKSLYKSKVAFIILSPSAIEANHSWLMRQF